jgi:hypothetical protein
LTYASFSLHLRLCHGSLPLVTSEFRPSFHHRWLLDPFGFSCLSFRSQRFPQLGYSSRLLLALPCASRHGTSSASSTSSLVVTYNDQDQGLLSLCPTLSAQSLSDRLASPCCGHSPDKSVYYISFIQSIALDFLLLLRRLKVSTGRGRLAHRARCRSSPGNLVRPLVNRLGPDTVLRQQTRHLVAHHLDHGHLWLKRWWRKCDNLIYQKPHFLKRQDDGRRRSRCDLLKRKTKHTMERAKK